MNAKARDLVGPKHRHLLHPQPMLVAIDEALDERKVALYCEEPTQKRCTGHLHRPSLRPCWFLHLKVLSYTSCKISLLNHIACAIHIYIYIYTYTSEVLDYLPKSHHSVITSQTSLQFVRSPLTRRSPRSSSSRDDPPVATQDLTRRTPAAPRTALPRGPSRSTPRRAHLAPTKRARTKFVRHHTPCGSSSACHPVSFTSCEAVVRET